MTFTGKFPSTFVGFDDLFDRLQAGTAFNWPPHNLIKQDEDYLLQLAAAGYSKEDIEIKHKDNILTIVGSKNDENVDYLHKGISSKRFERTFSLNSNIEVTEANMENGILSVVLTKNVPEDNSKVITIN
jgi:molecular chaperone IbpA